MTISMKPKRKILFTLYGLNLYQPRECVIIAEAYISLVIMLIAGIAAMAFNTTFSVRALGIIFVSTFIAGILQEMGITLLKNKD